MTTNLRKSDSNGGSRNLDEPSTPAEEQSKVGYTVQIMPKFTCLVQVFSSYLPLFQINMDGAHRASSTSKSCVWYLISCMKSSMAQMHHIQRLLNVMILLSNCRWPW